MPKKSTNNSFLAHQPLEISVSKFFKSKCQVWWHGIVANGPPKNKTTVQLQKEIPVCLNGEDVTKKKKHYILAN